MTVAFLGHLLYFYVKYGPEVIKMFWCSTQLSMKFSLLINMKIPTKVGKMSTKVGIFIFISRKNLHLLVNYDLICMKNFMLS